MTRISPSRRTLLSRGAAITAVMASGLWTVRLAHATPGSGGFEATTLAEVMQAWSGMPTFNGGSGDVVLTLPDLAENGAAVPVTVASSLPGVQEIAIVVESNPFPLVVRFSISDQTEAFVSTRVKMAQSGNVVAVVLANGKAHVASKAIKVTVGGCGN